MTDYAIDQNVVYDAWRGRKADKSPAIFENKFVYGFLLSKHRLLLNSVIQKKFTDMEKIEMKNDEFHDPFIVPMLMKLIFTDGRAEYATETPVSQKLIKKCDQHYVAVTIDKNGILVSHDGPLKAALQKHKELQSCNCMNSQEALPTLKS